jgi:predicted Zn-dependent peptidase
MTTRIFHKPEMSSEATLAAFDEIVREIQEGGISNSELEQLKVKWRSDYFDTLESGRGGSMPKFGLMHLLAGFTLFDGDPKLVNTILDGFLSVTKEQVREAARMVLQPQNRAIVFRKPSAQSAQEAA